MLGAYRAALLLAAASVLTMQHAAQAFSLFGGPTIDGETLSWDGDGDKFTPKKAFKDGDKYIKVYALLALSCAGCMCAVLHNAVSSMCMPLTHHRLLRMCSGRSRTGKWTRRRTSRCPRQSRCCALRVLMCLLSLAPIATDLVLCSRRQVARELPPRVDSRRSAHAHALGEAVRVLCACARSRVVLVRR